MDLYNFIMKIPDMILLILAVTFIYLTFFGGLGNLQEEIDQTQQNSYRRAVVLENLLSVNLTEGPRKDYSERPSLVERRAIISQQYFLEENEGEDPGYSLNEGHCYIPQVAGLDGETYGFYIERTAEVENPPDLGCTRPENPTQAISSPALLLRDEKDVSRVPVRIFVYQVSLPDYLEE